VVLRHALDRAGAHEVTIKRRPSSAASPGTTGSYVTSNVGACDFCGGPRAPGERRRFVWDSGVDGDLVLADLCARCEGRSKRLLEIFGGRGRDNVRLAPDPAASAVGRAHARRLGGNVLRGLVYVLIALASFVVVTLLTSHW
jgi:hypothetical protein